MAACTLLSLGCTGPSPGPVGPEADLGWATSIVRNPGSFKELMAGTKRSAWIAYFEHRYLDAAAGLPPKSVGYNRAIYAEIQLHRDLQRTASIATESLFSTWDARGALPPGDGPRVAAALAITCADEDADRSRWTGSLSAPTQAWLDHPGLWPDASAINPALALAADHHRNATSLIGMRALTQWAEADGALWRDPPGADGVARTWADPCVHTGVEQALLSAQVAKPIEVVNDLEYQLFAGPIAEHGSTLSPVETALGLTAQLPDSAQSAREEVRAMDERLDGVRVQLLAQADVDGQALLTQLDPLHRLRQEVLVDRARRALIAGKTDSAVATLMLARDVTDRSVGPRNSPALLALLTEANLRSGRVREALDALQPLVAARPEVAPLREILSDLVVLKGIDRRGDSKEH